MATDPLAILVDRIDDRLQALGLSDRKASLNAVGKPDLIRDVRRGSWPIGNRLSALAEALETTVDFLVGKTDAPAGTSKSDGQPKPPIPNPRDMAKDIPLYGTAIGADAAYVTERDGEVSIEMTDLNMADIIDHLRRPPALTGRKDIYALWVSGTSMEPAFESGRAILIDPKRPPSIRDYVVVYLRHKDAEDDRATGVLIKRLVRRSASYIELEQFNPAAVFQIASKDIALIQRVMPWDEAHGL